MPRAVAYPLFGVELKDRQAGWQGNPPQVGNGNLPYFGRR